MSGAIIREKIGAWLQLIRPPNLPTVPGDAIAGFLLAGLTESELDGLRVLPCIGTSLLLYMAGLIWNDCADYAEDLASRPQRPLPSGHISRRAATLVGTTLAAVGVAVSSLVGPFTAIISILLLGLILLYDLVTKRINLLGPLNMGLCRGFSMLVGASAVGLHGLVSGPVLIAASGVTFYICAVTSIASRETLPVKIGIRRWLPMVVLASCFVALFLSVKSFACSSLLIGLTALLLSWQWGRKLRGMPDPPVVSAAVGTFIKGLLLIQAVFCAFMPVFGTPIAVVLLLLWPVSTFLAKRFYAT